MLLRCSTIQWSGLHCNCCTACWKEVSAERLQVALRLSYPSSLLAFAREAIRIREEAELWGRGRCSRGLCCGTGAWWETLLTFGLFLLFTEQMDELLLQCFFHALKTKVKKSELPLLTSTFLRNHMVSCWYDQILSARIQTPSNICTHSSVKSHNSFAWNPFNVHRLPRILSADVLLTFLQP